MASATLTAVSVRLVATVAALLGGAAWVANYFVDVDLLPWTGAVLLGLAAAAVGSSLVRHPGIKIVSALGALLLAGSVFWLVYDSVSDPAVVHLVAGGLATLLVAVSLLRRPAGNH